ncbi:AAA family ATPase [Hyphomonas sp.]|uniref:AAA family ATPase n=1 Tax=Hyphomonas sp. TaxID=87 RepID=UPI0032ECC785
MIDTLEEFMRGDHTAKWLVEGVIAEGELTMLFGESGVGKSFASLDLALCVASGQPSLGRDVVQGPVVYLPSEGFDGFQARIQAWCANRGMTTGGIPFHMGAYELALNHPDDFNELESELNAIRPAPKLIVIDTLTGLTKGLDQNSAKDMAAFADTCKMLKLMTGAAVLVVHHSGHKDKGRSKGAVDFWAACDRVLGMTRVGRDGALAIKCAKSRNGAPFDDIHVRLQQYEPAAVLVEAEKVVKGETTVLTRGDRIFREVIGSKPIDEAKAKTAFNEKYGKSPGANRNAWSRAFDKAVSAGLIELDSDGLILPRTHTPQK